jgi:hypothetical protein
MRDGTREVRDRLIERMAEHDAQQGTWEEIHRLVKSVPKRNPTQSLR